jgi:hypothetical protein
MAEATTPSHGGIFISYRRQETAWAADLLYRQLRDQLGREQIFKDIDNIEPGDDFFEVISTAVGSCRVLLALIGKDWTTTTDTGGTRRLDDPADFVRLELQTALERGVRVIPVLIDGATMPRADELPATLAELSRRHAVELTLARFDSDFRRILGVVERTLVPPGPIDAEPEPGPSPAVVVEDPAPAPAGQLATTGRRATMPLPFRWAARRPPRPIQSGPAWAPRCRRQPRRTTGGCCP